jgi:hypothetical protein
LCDRCGWNYDGTMSREDARLENFYCGGL